MSSKRKKKIKLSPEEQNGAVETSAAKSADESSPVDSLEETSEQTTDKAVGFEQELEGLKQRLQRLGADYQNYQKRSHRQIEQAAQLARDEMAQSLLTVLDNFEHTLEKGQEADQVSSVLEGVKIVYDHLLNTLAGHGLQKMEVKPADPFDPTLHQAMLHEETDKYPENAVVRELLTGYVMNGRTLRPAKVSVAKPPQKPPDSSTLAEPQNKSQEQVEEPKLPDDLLPKE